MKKIRTYRALRGIALSSMLTLLAGCGGQDGAEPVFSAVIGGPGHTSGRFYRPRGSCWDRQNDLFYVVDWDGRVQKFTTAGDFRASWIMPEVQNGKPEDLCLSPSNTVYVADTHYSRVVEFSPDGKILQMFGSYGKAQGQFIYPVGICHDDKGDIYVAEYGDNDRIQKFTATGDFIMTWGGQGSGPGQFQRPSGIDFAPDGTILVADAVNHRIQVFDTEGRFIRGFGKNGTAPGEFRYPYDVAAGSNCVYVLEYGNQRVQKLTLDGRPLGMLGRPGRGDGCLACPWRFTVVADSLYVSDTDNGRVVVIPDSRFSRK